MKKFFSFFAAVLFAGSMMAQAVTFTMADYLTQDGPTTFTANGITVTAEQGAAQNAPVFVTYNNANDLRVYAKSTLKVSAAQEISAISFTISDQGKKRLAPLTVNAGAVEVKGTPDFTVTWAGSATEVVFTVGDKADYGTDGNTKAGQLDFTAITVTLSNAAVHTPTFTPDAATFEESVDVTIACATEGADIFYTLDGTEPTASSTKYTAAIKLTETTTVKAIAIKGDDKSAVASKTYTKKEASATTFATLAALVAADLPAQTDITVSFEDVVITGFYYSSSGQKNCGIYVNVKGKNNKDLEIYYKAEAVPAAWQIGGKVSGTIEGLWDYFQRDDQWEIVPSATGWKWSNLTYKDAAVATPTFAPAADEFEESVDVTIACATDGAEIFYTIDGTEPTASSTKYTAAIKLTATTTIKAIAVKGEDKSAIASKTYTKVDPAAILTCAEAAAQAATAGDKTYKAKGYVTEIAFAWKDGSMSFWMADTEDGGKVLEAYKCAVEKESDAPEVGDLVIVTGKLTVYKDTKEFAAGCTCEIVEKGQGGGGEEEELFYDYEPEEATTLNITFKGISITDYTAEYGVVDIILTDNEEGDYEEALEWAYLEFVTSSYDDEAGLPAGTYQINDSEAEGTFTASPGGDDDYDYPCYLGVPADEEGYYNPYYIVSGTVTISAEGIEVNAKSYFGSTLKLVYNAPKDAVETTKIAGKAVKSLENGALYLDNNGVRYNVIGQTVR